MKNVYSNNEDTIKAFAEGSATCRNSNGNIFAEGDILYSYGKHFPMAIRMDNVYLINGDKYSVTTSAQQNLCIQTLSPNVQIPFSGLRGANIVPEDIKILHWTSDTWVTVEYINAKGEQATKEVHHLGEVVLKHKRSYYLSGFDRNDGTRSYYLCKLPIATDNVEIAIESLKPQEVKEAIAQGKSVKRQGDLFFIPTDKQTEELNKVSNKQSRYKKTAHVAEIRKDNEGNSYARGVVWHKPLDKFRIPTHVKLQLGDVWHKIVKNMARGSWEATGLVD